MSLTGIVKSGVVVLLVACLAAGAAVAQEPAAAPEAGAEERSWPPPEIVPEGAHVDERGWVVLRSGRRIPPPVYTNETPEERMERIGLREDPGEDPDPKKIWSRFGKMYQIEKFSRWNAYYEGLLPGWVRPMWSVNIEKEIYREDDEHVWVWMEVYEVPTAEEILGRSRVAAEERQVREYVPYTDEQLEFVRQLKQEMVVIDPPAAGVTVRFESSSEGLPSNGSWRNGLAIADMNEDGHLDLIVPPMRGGGAVVPAIFLGDGRGQWKHWEKVQWPMGVNYGSVAAGDLNRDGHQDLVLGVHLYGVVVFLGDGKGSFTAANDGLPTDFPTRRAAIADLNGDGHLDIVAITEGPTLSRQEMTGSPLRGFLNDGTGTKWTETKIADDLRDVAGDWLTIGDFNGDRRIDVAGSSIIFHGTDLVYLSQGKGTWEPFGRGWFPFYSYYAALTSGKFSSKRHDDLILTYARTWAPGADPEKIPPPAVQRIVGVERVSWVGREPKRVPIMQWEGSGPVWGIADADWDGDGRLDLLFWRSKPNEFVLLLGDGKGGFRRGELEGLVAPEMVLYDLTARDVNGDGKPDLVVMYEKTGDAQGRVEVHLNRGVARR